MGTENGEERKNLWYKVSEKDRSSECQQKEMKQSTSEIVGQAWTLQNVSESWEVRHTQDSKGGTLDEMTICRERELLEPTFSRKTGHQMRDIPYSQIIWLRIRFWKNYRDGNGEEPEEKKFQKQAQIRIQLKGLSQSWHYIWGYGPLTTKDCLSAI